MQGPYNLRWPPAHDWYSFKVCSNYIDGLVQDYSNSSALAMELL